MLEMSKRSKSIFVLLAFTRSVKRVPMAADGDSVQPHAPIYVLVANVAGGLPDLIVQLIAQQPDMVLVGQARSEIELLLATAKRVDVLVMSAGQTTSLPGICSHLLGEFPDLRILALADGEQAATLYWLGLRQEHLDLVELTALIDGIRQAYRINPTI
jgi:hypothetical protein